MLVFLITIVVAGDQLSFVPAKRAQEALRAEQSASDRREGLIPVLAEFHIQMELLKSFVPVALQYKVRVI